MFLKSGVLLFLSFWVSFFSLDKLSAKEPALTSSRPELLYIPNGTALNFLSFGYNSALGHTLWFNGINYFGKHYRSDRNYQWLKHFCNLSTSLASEAKDYYQFCGTILSWETGDADAAISIYSKAIQKFPDDWLFYYLRGFTKSFFRQDPEGARDDFTQAAQQPDVHPLVTRLASKKIASSSGTKEAIEFLESAIELAKDPSTRDVLNNRLKELMRKQ